MVTDRALNQMLLDAFPELSRTYSKFVSWQDGDDTNLHGTYGFVLMPAIREAALALDKTKLKQYSDFVEMILDLKDENAENVIAVSVIEVLQDLDGPHRAMTFAALGPKARQIWLDMERWVVEHRDDVRKFNASLTTQGNGSWPWELLAEIQASGNDAGTK